MTTSLYNRRAGIRVELSAPSGFLLHVGVRYSQSNGLVTRDFNFSQHHHVKWGLRWLAAKLIALVAYIILGAQVIKARGSRGRQVVCLVLAVASFMYMAMVAVTKSPVLS